MKYKIHPKLLKITAAAQNVFFLIFYIAVVLLSILSMKYFWTAIIARITSQPAY